jgi:hypothetical protein
MRSGTRRFGPWSATSAPPLSDGLAAPSLETEQTQSAVICYQINNFSYPGPGYLTESQPDPSNTALSLRGLTLGYPAPTAVASATSLGEVKASLLDPNQAREVISKLHGLPISTQQDPSSGKAPSSAATTPIHAVCLDCSDEGAHEKWFSKLPHSLISAASDESASSAPSVAQAHADVLESFFKEIHLVNIVETPDFGFGQPPGGKGILSGSIPTAETISNGMSQATQQLMSFGFASTTAIWPNHAGQSRGIYAILPSY